MRVLPFLRTRFSAYFGDAWNGDTQLRQEMYQLYPDSYFLTCEGWGNRILTFEDRGLSDDLLAQNKGVIFF